MIRTFLSRWLGASSEPPGPPELPQLAAFSMAAPEALRQVYRIARDVAARGIAGDYVECGVHDGGSAAAMGLVFRDQERHGWFYDSFAGMPPTTEPDGPVAPKYVGKGGGSLERVHEALRLAGAEGRYTCRAGWFAETFQQPLPERVAMLHVDCDWYESVLLSLETFYPRVVEGGAVILDDFGHWEGAREAFYDYCTRERLKPLLERFGHTQVYWIKGRTHNRDFAGLPGVLKDA